MASSEFFTQAGNFGSAVSGGVDPRTGLFNLAIELGGLVGNRNIGPSLPLTMRYSPLSKADVGFGKGVSLGLTTYDTDRRLLSLSTGEQYKVADVGSDVVLEQNNLDVVRMFKEEDRYRIVRKSGDVEILTGPGNAHRTKVPTALLTPAGRGAFFSWDFGGAQPRLTEIADESDTLLTVEYRETKVVLDVLPDRPENYTVEMWIRKQVQDKMVDSVHLARSGQDDLVWTFSFADVGQQGEQEVWINGVTTPSGMSETASYGPGPEFPSSSRLPSLPRVARFVRMPGGEQPFVESTYTYRNSFVGDPNSQAAWNPDRDNLYEALTGYTYGSTESRKGGDQPATITREYNKYHLQTGETSWQNGCSRSVQTEYYAKPGEPFGAQPAQFQLPKSRTVTWTGPQNAEDSYQEVTETEFDASGNPLSQTEPDGTVTTWTYYPAEGSGSDCPPDPNGFTRLLAGVTRTPPETSFDAPVHETRYRYTAHTGTPDPLVETVVLKAEEQRHADGVLLTRQTFTYSTPPVVRNSASYAEYGRLVRLVETEYPDGDDGPDYTATHDFTFSVEEDALDQTHTRTTHDGLAVTRSESRSRFTGRLWSTTDPQGNVTALTYDVWGRLLTRTANPDTPYEARETHTYEIDATTGFVTTSTDPLGNQVRETLDGMGRPLRSERKDSDDDTWYTLRTWSYDARGRVSAAETLDHVRGGDTVALTRTFTYDDWGLLSATDLGNGASLLTETDPVHRTITTWRAGDGVPVTGREVTTVDARGEPVSVEWFDLDDVRAGGRSVEYDGWGRTRRETDELGNVTRYDYDSRGRLVRTTLADDTEVSRTYAPFSADALVTEVSVNAVPYGTQEFDGLGRTINTTSGGRTWHQSYARPGDPLPSSVTAPDGGIRTYAYVPALGNALSELTAGSLTQRFAYHPVSGSLTRAEEDEVTITRDYHPSGLLSSDASERASRFAYTTRWSYTVGGLEDGYTEADGAAQRITRDVYGRISVIDDPAMRVTTTYDDADRVSGWTTEAPDTGHTLTTALTLDDFGREVERTITDGQGTSWTLTQAWRYNSLIGRTLSRDGTILRDETFAYNARNQLTEYLCGGTALSRDDRGNAVAKQTFVYDGYGNITHCESTFSEGSGSPDDSDTATYAYENASDPCQLTGVRHTHPSYPASLELIYDAAGRLVTDDAGRTLAYDALGRLRSVGAETGAETGYIYDPLDRLLVQETGGTTEVLSYRQDVLGSVLVDDERTRLLRTAPGCVAQHRGEGARADTRLLGTDGKRTVLVAAMGGEEAEEYTYTAYGHRPVVPGGSVLGYDGERTDPALGWLHLGNGYRAYHPGLMRFTAPDILSPFDEGGINPYAYCLGDPINRTDPSGHLSFSAWLGIGLGIAGLVATVLTGGAAIVAAGGVAAAVNSASATALVVGTLGVVSDVTAVVSGALEEVSPKASSILGWVSTVTGSFGDIAEAAGARAARKAGRDTAKELTGRARGLAKAGERIGEAADRFADAGELIDEMAGHLAERRQRPTGAGAEDATRPLPPRTRAGGDTWLAPFETESPRGDSPLEGERPKRPAGPRPALSAAHGDKSVVRSGKDPEARLRPKDPAIAVKLRRHYPRAALDTEGSAGEPQGQPAGGVDDSGLTNATRSQ
ncbi:RHS repeat-associated core domain-containing protein [Streptomyces sp. NPDC046203]|uniref:RHS repeat-associated core domain-containing protein n=1 Tax=Streptomyces sp. NPDC046203 TaxID=3154602 RepID=UPI0033F92EA6